MRLSEIEKKIEESGEAKATIEEALDTTAINQLPQKKTFVVVWAALGKAALEANVVWQKGQRDTLAKKYIESYYQ